MQRGAWLWLVGILVFAFLFYRGGDSPDRPQPGDTITPVLGQKLTWAAGNPVELAVRLEARGKDGTTRPLGFGWSTQYPVAEVVFYDGESRLRSQQVTLSHLC